MNEKFSYAEDFVHTSGIARMELGDLAVRYSVLVGDPDNEFTFLDSGNFFCRDFITQQDAANALSLVKQTLERVDENLAQGLKLSCVRDEVLANINRATSGNLISKSEVERAVNEIFTYYIEHGA